jgi:hypothetical protein
MEFESNGRKRFGSVRRAIDAVRTKASAATAHVPEAVGHVREGAQGTMTNLQTVPDSGLRLLAAVSVGFGAGLRLAGKKRLAALAGFAPASVFGLAIFSRPRPVHAEPRPVRP